MSADPAAVHRALIAHAEARRAYRVAVFDPPPEQSVAETRAPKGGLETTRAALHHPWVVVASPAAATDSTAPRRIAVPPSGSACGIHARTDAQRCVWKAPANEAVTGAVDLQRLVSNGEQELPNPLDVNRIWALPDRGIRICGGRMLSSDPEWVYLDVRRCFLYLENSIDRGTRWAVFEPNGERLRGDVRTSVEDLLYAEWRAGALLGPAPEAAYLMRCDRSTMSQADLDNGRLLCLVGVAVLKQAESVIFRIGQKTTDQPE